MKPVCDFSHKKLTRSAHWTMSTPSSKSEVRGRRSGAEWFQQPQGGVRQASLARGWRQSRPLLAPHAHKLTSNYAPSADAQATLKPKFIVDLAALLRLCAALGCVLGAHASWRVAKWGFGGGLAKYMCSLSRSTCSMGRARR